MSEIRRQFQEFASSGEITEQYIGGTTSEKKVATIEDVRTGKAQINIETEVPMNLDDTYQIVPFNVLLLQRYGVTADLINHSITVTDTDLYEMFGSINVHFTTNRIVEFKLFVNGFERTIHGVQLAGLGTGNPTDAVGVDTLSLNAGDTVDLRARCIGNTVAMGIYGANLAIKTDR